MYVFKRVKSPTKTTAIIATTKHRHNKDSWLGSSNSPSSTITVFSEFQFKWFLPLNWILAIGTVVLSLGFLVFFGF